MATLEQNEANLVDAEEVNWQIIVFPLLAVFVVVIGGFLYYYYLQNQREEMEANARAAFVQAKTPEEMIKVAEQYPKADAGTIALLSAADASFTKHDFAGAIAAYQRVTGAAATDPALNDAAEVGLGSAYEASDKFEDAIKAYAAVGDRGSKSALAPYAYIAAARVCEAKGDKDSERRFLTQAAALDPDSAFVKDAQQKLKELQPAPVAPAPPTPPPAPAVSATPATAPAAPAPVAPAPAK